MDTFTHRTGHDFSEAATLLTTWGLGLDMPCKSSTLMSIEEPPFCDRGTGMPVLDEGELVCQKCQLSQLSGCGDGKKAYPRHGSTVPHYHYPDPVNSSVRQCQCFLPGVRSARRGSGPADAAPTNVLRGRGPKPAVAQTSRNGTPMPLHALLNRRDAERTKDTRGQKSITLRLEEPLNTNGLGFHAPAGKVHLSRLMKQPSTKKRAVWTSSTLEPKACA